MKTPSCNICKKKSLKKILIFGKKPIVHHLKNSKNVKEKKYMVLFGSESYRYTGQSNKHLLEGLSNIKDIKILRKLNI